MIIYTCPKCGNELDCFCITTYPPITVHECGRCGWRHEDKDEIEHRPFEPIKAKLDEDWTMYEAIDNVMTNG